MTDSATEDQRSSIASDSTLAGSSAENEATPASSKKDKKQKTSRGSDRSSGRGFNQETGEEEEVDRDRAITPTTTTTSTRDGRRHRPTVDPPSIDRVSVQSSSGGGKFSGADSLGLGNAGLVDLHPNMTKPITDSVFLMSSYVNHLSQFQCDDWTTAAPDASYNPDSSAVGGGGGGGGGDAAAAAEGRNGASQCCGFHVHRSTGSMYLSEHLPVFTYVRKVGRL